MAILVAMALLTGLTVGLLTAPSAAASSIPGAHVALPRLDYGDVYGTGDWDSLIQIKNTSALGDSVTITFWGQPGPCAPSERGELFTMTRWLSPGTTWTIPGSVVRNNAEAFGFSAGDVRSAIIEGDAASGSRAAPLAVTTWRSGPDEDRLYGSSVYEGVSESMDGSRSTPSILQYFAPTVMKGFFGLDTELTIQNSGMFCTSVRIEYREQARGTTCILVGSQHIGSLARGEAVRVRIPDNVATRPFLGSAHIRANQPLAIVIDETTFTQDQSYTPSHPQNFTAVSTESRGTLLSDRAEVWKGSDTNLVAGLIYGQLSGWQTTINVQNKGVRGRPTFVTVSFFDNGGGHMTFLGEWVCFGGGRTFFLPSVRNLGFPFGGAAEIRSQSQVRALSSWTADGEPIFATVGLKKTTDLGGNSLPPASVQGAAYNAQSLSTLNSVRLEMPYVAKEFAPDPGNPNKVVSSVVALRNNSNRSQIQVELRFGDSVSGSRAIISRLRLGPKQVRLIDLRNLGNRSVPPGWTGAIAAELVGISGASESASGNSSAGYEPGLLSAVVVNLAHGPGAPEGDRTTAYSAFPSP